MSNHVSGIKQYFDLTASRFDQIYSTRKPWHQRLVDAAFRKTVNQRYDLILKDLGDVGGRTVLDVGTGSGRYAIELAARGAHVTGVDFSDEMLHVAVETARSRGIDQRCRWLQGEFLELKELSDHYDISLGIGLFDYISDPGPVLRRMWTLTSQTMFLSFPKRWTARTLPRKLRLAMNGCYVRFYSRREIEGMVRSLPERAHSFDILSVNRDYILRVRFR